VADGTAGEDRLTIIIWVEGDSDKAALDELLPRFGGQWGQKGVRLDVKVAGGRTKLLRDIGEYAARDFKDGAAYVFALADVHAEDRDAEDVRTRLRAAVHAVVEDPGLRERFRPHAAVPEMETWLLADPSAIAKATNARRRRIVVPPNPERLKPGQAERELDRLLKRLRRRNRGYRKTADARGIASYAKPDTIAKKCRYFRELVEDLARCAGIGEAES